VPVFEIDPAALRRAREAAGLSRVQTAFLIKKSVESVDAWETARRRPSAATLLLLAKVFGVDVYDLVAEVDDPAVAEGTRR
jgi:transcriptional regulator with XRE-family HTH domain